MAHESDGSPLSLSSMGFKIARVQFQNVPDALSGANEAVEAIHGLLADLQAPEFQSAKYLELIEKIKTTQDQLPDLKVVPEIRSCNRISAA